MNFLNWWNWHFKDIKISISGYIIRALILMTFVFLIGSFFIKKQHPKSPIKITRGKVIAIDKLTKVDTTNENLMLTFFGYNIRFSFQVGDSTFASEDIFYSNNGNEIDFETLDSINIAYQLNNPHQNFIIIK